MNKSRLSEAMITAAKRQVSPLARAKKGIIDPLVDYLCDGEGERVLLTLADIPKGAVVMKLNCIKPPWERRSQMEASRRRFFELASKEAPVLLFRFAKIAEATAGENMSPVWESLPDDLRWFDVLLNEALEICSWRCRNPLDWDVPLLQEILAVAGQPADRLPTLILKVDTDDESSAREAVLSMPGVAAMFSQHGQAVGEALLQESAPGKVHALTELGRLKVSFAPYIDSLALLALDRAKTVREAAMEQLAHLDTADLRQAIEGMASKGPAIQRQQAVQLLGERYGAASHEFLRGLGEGQKSQKVRQEIDRIVGVPQLENKRDEPSGKQPISPSSSTAAICEVIADAFAQAVTASDAAAQKAREREKSRRGRLRGHRKIISKAIEFLRKGGQLKRFSRVLRPEVCDDATWRPYRDLVATQDLTLVGMWRLLHMLGCEGQGHTLSQNGTMLLLSYRLSHDPELDLRRLAAAAKAARLSGRFVAAMYLPRGRGAFTNALELAPEAIWPFFADFPRYLEEALGRRKQDDADCWEISEERQRAFCLLAMLPKIPSAIVPILWDLALGRAKVDRAGARACLANSQNKEYRIIAALSSGKKDVRAVAANWLANLGHVDAARPIKDALKKETCDIPKAAMISALERFGLSVEAYVNRTRLLEDAQAVLQHSDPEIIAWFPSDQLPAVHWEADKQQVAPEILHGFLVQACQLKSIEPSPLTRRSCEQMDPAERRAFGSFVLQAWLSEDTKRRYTPEEAAAKADRDATWYSGVYDDPEQVENYRKQCYQKYLSECAGGASASRGVLAIAACCADSNIVSTISDYLETYPDGRMSQCKSLLALLAQFHHPLATRLLLSIPAHSRSKALQQEAARLAAELASRNGWTRDELADRNIPTAGFDENGGQEIDYGPRQFEGRLAANFAVVLTEVDGEQVKKLPGANEGEDEDTVKAARNAFFANTRELKQQRKLQQERLYEAMCTRRAWRFEDWDLSLNRHPIVSRHCARLVWVAGRDDTWTIFRPQGDRSFTGLDDKTLCFSPDDRVMLAHSSELSAEERAVWREHFSKHEITSLFEQFRESALELPEDQKQATEITDFRGHMIGSLALHRVLTGLNYVRGQTGGTYYKHFPNLRLQAVIETVGGGGPEEDLATALLSLYFEDAPEGGDRDRANTRLALGRLPAVLLSECWNDVKRAAETGTGYDNDWEKASRIPTSSKAS